MQLEIKGLTKKIHGKTVLDDVTLSFTGGKIYGLRGKNGCGKTMLMRSLSGLMRPTKGEIWIKGKQLYKEISVPESVGVLIENPAFLGEYTGFDNLKILAGLIGGISEQDLLDLLDAVGLSEAKNKKYYKYSLGMKQRLGVAGAVLGMPELILLDEPINAIDEKSVAGVRDLIISLKNEERIIIVACHDREEMELLADKVIEMSEGRIL